MTTPRWILLASLALAVCGQALAQTGAASFEPRRARVFAAPPGQVLAASPGAAPADLVARHLRALGVGEAAVNSLRQVAAVSSRRGLVFLRMEQEVDGLTVHGAYVKAALNGRGELVHLIENLAPVPSAALAAPAIGAQQALLAALARVFPDVRFNPGQGVRSGNTTAFAGDAFFFADPSVTRVAVPNSDGTMSVGFSVETWSRAKNLLHHTLVSGDGNVLDVQLRTATDSYNVFPIDPGKTPQTVIAGPGSGNAESPAGWLDGGSQSTIAISGNNADAYLDSDGNNRADRGGGTVTTGDFLAAANLGVAPSVAANQAVAVQNLFYLTNVTHDILYRHGFDEQAGNFQQGNFGLGGKERDPVQAEAQDGSGVDNANFATPSDGRKPRMQMFLWTGAGATHRVTVSGTNFDAMGAAFGPVLTATGITGQMVTTSPADGCTAISTALAGRIALIDRGSCDFSAKVLNAQSAGAAAVVIANNQGGTEIFTMGAGSGAKRVRIPSVMVSQNNGTTLKAQAPVAAATVARLDPQPLQIDGALDSDIVYHEYGHGLTWRMIGGMSGPLAGAIGEGASDGVAMLINNDDVIGEYASGLPLGIRRFRYQGYPLRYGNVTGAEVHDDGEIYAAIVWRMIELFRGAYGDGPGRSRLFDYVVDGMNFTPSTPTFEQMRDGILASVRNGPAPADCTHVWSAFGEFGVGVGAQGLVSGSTVQVTESFVVPAACN